MHRSVVRASQRNQDLVRLTVAAIEIAVEIRQLTVITQQSATTHCLFATSQFIEFRQVCRIRQSTIQQTAANFVSTVGRSFGKRYIEPICVVVQIFCAKVN